MTIAVPILAGGVAGDGNADGTPDSAQLHVASLPNATDDHDYVTLQAVPGTGAPATLRLVDVQAITPETLSPLPAGVVLPEDVVSFRVEGIPPLFPSVNVTLIYHSGFVPTTYWKFGPTFDVPVPHWYQFPVYNGTAGTVGAEFVGNKVILHLLDGGLGDADGLQNGVIVDPGGPGLIAAAALNIAQITSTEAKISWPLAAGNLALLYTPSLSAPIIWMADTNVVVTNGALKSVTINLTNAFTT